MSDVVAVTAPARFVLTPELIYHVRLGQIAGSSSALILSLLVCFVSLYIYSVPEARHHLDRVSFRLLLWSMIVEVVYTVDFIIGTNLPGLPNQPAGCSVVMYILLSTMGTANWLCTCIGINLMLAISFGINSIQAKLERWYIIGSFTVGFVVPLGPAIMQHFGRDPLYGICYFTQGEKTQRIKDFVLDLYLWQLLSCAVAAGSVAMVLVTLYSQSRATHRALFHGHDLTISPADLRDFERSQGQSQAQGVLLDSPDSDIMQKEATGRDTVHRPSPPAGDAPHWFWRLLPYKQGPTSSGCGSGSGSSRGRSSQMHRLEDKLVTIALKISLYPLVLLLINIVITAEDLRYSVRGGLYSYGDYGFYWLHNFLYGGRGIFFALLGIFVDPCLRLGLPAALRASFGRKRQRQSRRDPDDSEIGGGDTDTPGRMPWDHTQSISDFLSSNAPDSVDFAQLYETKTLARSPILATRSQYRGSSAENKSEAERGLYEIREGEGDKADSVVEEVPGDEAVPAVVPLHQDAGRRTGDVGAPPTGSHETRRPASTSLTVRILSPRKGDTADLSGPESAQLSSREQDAGPLPATSASHSGLAPTAGPPRSAPLSHTSRAGEGAARPPRQPRERDPRDWIEPLAIAVRTNSRGSDRRPRSGSDPIAGLGVAQRRRGELQVAAEEMYAEAQKAL